MSITDKTLVERDVSRTEHSTTLTATVSVTLDGGNTIDETGAVELTDDNMCLTEDIICRAFADGSCVITYTTLPTTTIDVTCRTAFYIGISRGNEIIVEIILGYIILVVHRTYSACSIEVLRDFTAKQSDKGSAVHVAGIRSIRITQTTAVCIGTAQASVIHITADISTLVDADIGVVFIGGQSISKSVVSIATTQ